jgi:hypothetical protein
MSEKLTKALSQLPNLENRRNGPAADTIDDIDGAVDKSINDYIKGVNERVPMISEHVNRCTRTAA